MKITKRSKLVATLLALAIAVSAITIALGSTFAAADVVETFPNPNPVSKGYYQMEIGDTWNRTVSYAYAWQSTNPEVATVVKQNGTSIGKVTAVAKKTATIVATTSIGSISTVKIQVSDPNGIGGYTIKNGSEGYISDAGKTFVVPITTDVASAKSQITWTSLTPNIISVDKNGTITTKTKGLGMVIGNFSDKWGVDRMFYYTLAVGVNTGNHPAGDLIDLINQAEEILAQDPPQYTDETLNNLFDEVEDAKNVVNNPNSSQNQYDTAKDELQNALDNLEKLDDGKGDGDIITIDGEKYKPVPGTGGTIVEVLDPDETSKTPPEYIYDPNKSITEKGEKDGDEVPAYTKDNGNSFYVENPAGSNIYKKVDEDGKLTDSPAVWGGPDYTFGGTDDKPAIKGGDGKYYVEDPTNIWWPVGSNGSLGTSPIWGGTDKKPGSADDKPAAKGTDGKYYTEVEDGINIWQPVDGNGNLVNSGYVGGGASKVPNPAIPAEKVDGKWYVGPFGSDNHYWSVGADGKSQSDANGNNGSDDKKNWKGSDGKMTDTDPNAATVTGVTISPASVTVRAGTTQTFTATVTGTGNPDQGVTWSINGKNAATTKISAAGVLTIAASETATSLTITATSTVDGTKAGTATVMVGSTSGGGTDEPTGVTGRELIGSDIGDSSNWIEIAQTTKDGETYSLIVRSKVIKTSDFGTNNSYFSSTLRTTLNTWFKNTNNIKGTAVLRDYTVKPSSLPIGTHGSSNPGNDGFGIFDGFSTPGAANKGLSDDDVCFILSVGEASRFLSKQWMRLDIGVEQDSNAIALANWNALSDKSTGTWLRSVTTANPSYATHTNSDGTARGGFYTVAYDQLGTRPALWVNSEIFEDLYG